jgi:uncharacterized membrane protein YqjE
MTTRSGAETEDYDHAQVATDTAYAGASPAGSSPADGDDRSLGEIMGDIAKDLTTLLRQELDLAKTEAKNEAKKAGKGAGLLGGAGVAAHFVLLFLSLALLFLLDEWMHAALAAVIVTAVWGIVAAVLALRGRKELRAVNPTLETTQRTLKEDAQWAKEQKSS